MKHMHFSVGTPSKPAKGEAMKDNELQFDHIASA